MNDITTVRTTDVIASEINGIKAQARTMVLCSTIEIGRRLVEAKSMVDHGQWGEWLEKSVDYSKSTANNLMRIFEEYGADQIPLFGDNSKSQALGNLSYTQAVALLGVPADERESFIQENKIDEMSTRELQQAIKERDEAQRKLDLAKTTIDRVTDERDKFKKETFDLSFKATTALQQVTDKEKTVKILQGELEKERQRTKDEVKRLVGLLDEARADGLSTEKINELEAALKDAQEQVVTLTEELNKPVTVEATVVDNSGAAIQKYSAYFEIIVGGFKNLLGALAEIKEVDAAAHEKYRNAVSGLIGKMSERLE